VPEPFAARFAAARSKHGPLVLGADPSGPLLTAWGIADNADGLERFTDIVLAAAAGTVGLIKPQSAFYERHGWAGIRALSRLLAGASSAGLLTILDVKRGDVGSTNASYAEAYLGSGAPLAADAITVHPYLGVAAMGSFVRRAHEAGGCLLIVTRSSNPEGSVVQGAVAGDGGTVDQLLLRQIGQLNATLAPGEVGPVGAVIGPVARSPALDLPAAGALFLAPGVGAQGATVADVAGIFAACPDRVMPSASRSLLAAGPGVPELRAATASLAAEFRAALPGPAAASA
jgi:orotidine-5'-phosphate decarboxylase